MLRSIDRPLRGKRQGGKVGQPRGRERGPGLRHTQPSNLQVAVVHDSRVDEPLQPGVGEELPPGEVGERRRVGPLHGLPEKAVDLGQFGTLIGSIYLAATQPREQAQCYDDSFHARDFDSG